MPLKSYSSWFDHPNNWLWRQIMKVLIMSSFLFPCYLVSVRPKIFISILFLSTLSLITLFSLRVFILSTKGSLTAVKYFTDKVVETVNWTCGCDWMSVKKEMFIDLRVDIGNILLYPPNCCSLSKDIQQSCWQSLLMACRRYIQWYFS
jgi:hypothetical protein